MDEIRIGKTFISEDSPAGTDTRYEPAFEELQAEIDKLGSPTAVGETNWQRVSDLAEKILTEESKDLLVGSYFAVSRIYIDDLPGLVTGMQVFKDLLETFWDTMFPKKKRMRGRVAAADWWVEKSATALEMLTLESVDKSTKEKLLTDCDQLKQLFQDLFPDPPAISMLARVVKALPVNEENGAAEPQEQQTQVPETKTAPVVEQPAAATNPVTQPPPPAPEPIIQHPVESSDDAVKAIQSHNENIKRAALSLVEHNPANPLGHRSLRTAIWSDLDSPPQAVDNRTIIPPPEPHIIGILQDLTSRGDWQNLVIAAEVHFAQYVFWLDLQRYCANGLERLGPSYEKAYDAVCQETATFMVRMPGLSNLQFADGLAFADEETQEWCQSLGGGNSVDLASGFSSSEGSPEEAKRLTDAIQLAGELVKERKLPEAVELLQTGIHSAHSAREAMQWRLPLVQILIGGKKAEIALSHCEILTREAQYYNLDQWDPAQALTIYRTFYHCLKKISSKVFKERGPELLGKIAGLDSAEAIRISS